MQITVFANATLPFAGFALCTNNKKNIKKIIARNFTKAVRRIKSKVCVHFCLFSAKRLQRCKDV